MVILNTCHYFGNSIITANIYVGGGIVKASGDLTWTEESGAKQVQGYTQAKAGQTEVHITHIPFPGNILNSYCSNFP